MSDDNLDELERQARDRRRCLAGRDEAYAPEIDPDVVLKLIALARTAESWRQAAFRHDDRAERYELALRMIVVKQASVERLKQVARQALKGIPVCDRCGWIKADCCCDPPPW